MNTSQIKNFAAQSRNILKAGVIQRIQILGFDVDGNLTKGEPTRIEIQGGATLFAGEIFDGSFYDRWMSLRHRIQEKGVKEVYEEAAYTWFNRLVAIRIMMKNGFIDPVLAYTNEQTRIPRIVAEARAGRVGKMTPADREKLRELMGDDARINEQFALLIDNFCRNNAVIFNCFGGIEEYISLLLPDNILAPGGFIDLLNHTSYITDDDFKQSELIGWLYQFYISEKKDEVFAKQGKYTPEEIPAATQIFTPNWIVKYMVQNTIGRIYLDNNPWATDIKDSMKYLVEPAEPTPKDAILKLESIEDYKLLDNACGSGHILVEAFGLFYKMYLEEGYSSHKAIESILRKNLVGVDLDTRAKQLATFALLMTAAKVDSSFLDCKVMPRVLDMPAKSFSRPLYELLREFYMGEDRTVIEETMKAFDLLEQSDTLGSIMKFSLSDKTRREMALRFKEREELILNASGHSVTDKVSEILPSVSLIIALTDKYSAVVTNPPYMGSGKFDSELSSYVVRHYKDAKTDLFAVFMLVGMNALKRNGKLGMINMHSWMFQSSFEDLRLNILSHYTIENMLHLGARTFDELSGEVVQNVSFILLNHLLKTYPGTYFRLVEGNNCEEKRQLFLKSQNGESNIKTAGFRQSEFGSLPSNTISYWVSNSVINAFANSRLLDSATPTQGYATGDNPRFLRQWHEVSFNKFCDTVESYTEAYKSGFKWFPTTKGGEFRRWYGNKDFVIAFDEENYTALSNMGNHLPSKDTYFKLGAAWTIITSGNISFRRSEHSTFEHCGSMCFAKPATDFDYLIAYLNSNTAQYFLNAVSPTLSYREGVLKNIPFINCTSPEIVEIAKATQSISQKDWDAHETSWDFKENELVRVYKENHGDGIFMKANRLEDIVTLYKEYWTEQFNQLHANEEELNRQFIEIYGLQEELTPDVPLDEITILQQGEISIEAGKLIWHNDVLVKQLISYAIGCMMGRYRLDRPGLHIAYPNPSAADVEAYNFQGEPFEIDDDGIIPLLPRDCPFDDNARNRLVRFIRQVFGESLLNENLNFLEASLGRTLEDYLVKDFWKVHKKMYSNRPIYWLFSSKRGAFQCLTYMHRMNPYTAEAVRSKYLLPYIDFLKGKIAADMERASSLSTIERRNLDKMQMALDECLEYEERLHDVADRQIRIDLDNGVPKNYALFGNVLAPIR